jgi:hypothetical protein
MYISQPPRLPKEYLPSLASQSPLTQRHTQHETPASIKPSPHTALILLSNPEQEYRGLKHGPTCGSYRVNRSTTRERGHFVTLRDNHGGCCDEAIRNPNEGDLKKRGDLRHLLYDGPESLAVSIFQPGERNIRPLHAACTVSAHATPNRHRQEKLNLLQKNALGKLSDIGFQMTAVFRASKTINLA